MRADTEVMIQLDRQSEKIVHFITHQDTETVLQWMGENCLNATLSPEKGEALKVHFSTKVAEFTFASEGEDPQTIDGFVIITLSKDGESTVGYVVETQEGEESYGYILMTSHELFDGAKTLVSEWRANTHDQ